MAPASSRADVEPEQTDSAGFEESSAELWDACPLQPRRQDYQPSTAPGRSTMGKLSPANAIQQSLKFKRGRESPHRSLS